MSTQALLVHPTWFGADYWAPVLDRIDQATTVDLPGFGHAPGPFTADRAVQAVVEKLESIGEPVDLIGLSLGARVSLSVAVKRPELLRSLVLLGIGDDVGRFAAAVQRLALRIIGKGAAERIGGSASVSSAREAAGALPELRIRENAPRVSVPTLVVAGGADKEFSAGTNRVADLVPSAQLRTIPNADHLWPAERPEDFAELLADWRSDLASPFSSDV